MQKEDIVGNIAAGLGIAIWASIAGAVIGLITGLVNGSSLITTALKGAGIGAGVVLVSLVIGLGSEVIKVSNKKLPKHISLLVRNILAGLVAGIACFLFAEWVLHAGFWIRDVLLSSLLDGDARALNFAGGLAKLGVTKIEFAILFGVMMSCSLHPATPNNGKIAVGGKEWSITELTHCPLCGGDFVVRVNKTPDLTRFAF